MARSRRGKNKISRAPVYERLSRDLPSNAMVVPVEVADPYEIGAKLLVMRSLRDDPLARMLARAQIDEAQFAAGRLWQRHHENSEIGGVSAIDPQREAVDGGRIPEPITDRQIKAIQKLTEADRELGREGAAIVRMILGNRYGIAQVASIHGDGTEREIWYIGRRFRASLDILAKLWGLA
jgi:hypothetical protein